MATEKDCMVKEISLYENAVYVVKEGKVTKINAMRHGVDEIVWKDGIVQDVVRSHRVRLGQVEEIDENP